jgi:hypothetical protein
MSRVYIEGGKIKKPKSLKQIGRDINKKVIKPIEKTGNKALNAIDTLAPIASDIGQFTNKQLLPAVTTIGIPIASTALGMAGEYLGGPLGGMAAESISSNLMKEYIPKQYQSKNKYIQALGDIVNQAGKTALTGEFDPEATMGTMTSLIPQGRRSAKQNYNPENPYEDLLRYYTRGFPEAPEMIPTQLISQYDEPEQQKSSVSDGQDGIYSSGDIDDTADSVKITKSPYDQKEGSTIGLLGGGIKKKKGRYPKGKSKSAAEIQRDADKKEAEAIKKMGKKSKVKKVEIVKYLPHERFSHAENESLRQLLHAKELRDNEDLRRSQKDASKAMLDLTREMRGQFDDLKRERDFYKEALGQGMRRYRKN